MYAHIAWYHFWQLLWIFTYLMPLFHYKVICWNVINLQTHFVHEFFCNQGILDDEICPSKFLMPCSQFAMMTITTVESHDHEFIITCHMFPKVCSYLPNNLFPYSHCYVPNSMLLYIVATLYPKLCAHVSLLPIVYVSHCIPLFWEFAKSWNN